MNELLSEGFAKYFETIDTAIAGVIADVYANPFERIVIACLLSAGLYFTIKTRFVQFRLFPHMLKSVLHSRRSNQGGISSFQAFAIGIASRVGTGNIAGVAIALVLGGPGAIFWMWLIALIGMATACVEAILAQLFKVPAKDNSFRGGPAYYIRTGLGSPGWGKVFAVMLIFAFGFSFNMVQANTIASVTTATFGIPSWAVALILLAITVPITFGGIKAVAHIAEIVAPIMALAYMLLACVIIVLHFDQIPAVLFSIVANAFGYGQVAGGLAGGLFAAVANGAKRGLFSNEAGMGSAPNAAATATVRHPVQQGLIQSLGVFVDTILVCTATACIVLLGGIYKQGETTITGAELTVRSISNSLGGWVVVPMVIIIIIFAYSSILGNYAYAEINVNYLRGMDASLVPLNIVVIVSVGLGSVMSLESAWNLADIFSAIMVMLNIFALFVLGKWALGALRDYEAQRKNIQNDIDEPLFISTNNPYMPGELPSKEWTEDTVARRTGW